MVIWVEIASIFLGQTSGHFDERLLQYKDRPYINAPGPTDVSNLGVKPLTMRGQPAPLKMIRSGYYTGYLRVGLE